MKYAKRVATSLGYVILAAALVSVLAPKATHAIVATLVQVANTSANPVPNSDVDSAAHATVVPLGCFVNLQDGGPAVCTLSIGGGAPYTIPAGQRLVIEQLSAFCQSSSDDSIPNVEFGIIEANTEIVPRLALTSKQNFEFVTQPVRYYADPGTQIFATAEGNAITFCNYYANGYLVSYP